MNVFTGMGRLTKDPELKYTPSHMAVCTFTLAIDRPAKSGEEKKTDFPRITVFGKSAENCAKYLKKGKRAIVEGSFRTDVYQNQQGENVYTAGITANRVEFLDWDKDTQSNLAPAAPVQAQAAPAPAPSEYATEVPAPSGGWDYAEYEDDEDVPF